VSFGGNAAALFPNAWLRVRRIGNTILRYSSTNGVNWTFDAQTSPYPPLPNTAYVGIAVCANVGQRTLQQPVLAQIDNYGDFAGYGNTNTLAVTGLGGGNLATNSTIGAGSAVNLNAVATVTGGGIPNNGGGEVGFLWQRTNTAVGGWTNMPSGGQTTAA